MSPSSAVFRRAGLRASGGLGLDRQSVDRNPAIDALVGGRLGFSDERSRDGGTGKSPVAQLRELLGILRSDAGFSDFIVEVSLACVPRVPLALLQQGFRPASADRLQDPSVRVADDSPRLASRRAKNRSSCLDARSGGPRHARVSARPVADRAKDICGYRPAGYSSSARILGPDPGGQVIEQQRNLRGPRVRPMGCRDHWRDRELPEGPACGRNRLRPPPELR